MEGDSIGTEECQWDNDNLDFLLESIGNDLSTIQNLTRPFCEFWPYLKFYSTINRLNAENISK